jgi:acyl carrier protein
MQLSDLTQQVLACANRVAGTRLSLASDEDIPLEAFHLDSLTLFAFIVELEKESGIDFDDAVQNYERLRTVRSTAEFIAQRVRTRSSTSSSSS